MTQTALIAVSDLMFQSRIRAAAEARGLAVRVAHDETSVADAVAAAPALAIVDLHERGVDPIAVVRDAHSAAVPVLAFGRHTEPGLLRQARDAGADLAVPRSQLAEELPALIESLLASADQQSR